MAQVAFRINLDKYFVIQQSNMSKLGDDGKPIYNEHGKVLKDNYFRQIWKVYKMKEYKIALSTVTIRKRSITEGETLKVAKQRKLS